MTEDEMFELHHQLDCYEFEQATGVGNGQGSLACCRFDLQIELQGLISLQSKRLSSVFSNTTVQKHQFSSTQLSLWSNSHIAT